MSDTQTLYYQRLAKIFKRFLEDVTFETSTPLGMRREKFFQYIREAKARIKKAKELAKEEG